MGQANAAPRKINNVEGSPGQVMRSGGSAVEDWVGFMGAKVADILVPADTTTITVTGLDLDAAKIYEIIFIASNATTSSCAVYIFFNNDTTLANYSEQHYYARGAAMIPLLLAYPEILGLDASTSHGGLVHGYIARDPNGRVWFRSFWARGPVVNQDTGGDGITWSTLANVTRIDITAEVADAIKAGSRLMIFRASG